MDASANSADDTSREQASIARKEPPEPPALECVIVRYENRPDQCTLSPIDCSDETKLTAWMTAPTDVFIALDEYR